MPERLRVAWFSVLSRGIGQAASVSAYTSEMLLPYLRDAFEIDLFHDSFEPFSDYPTRHYLEAAARHAARPYDLFFYQLEDAPAANFVRIHIGLLPGIVLFHDLMLSNHGPEPILNSPWKETLCKFDDPGHPWPRRGSEFNQDGPLGYREAGYAAVALFSNPASHADYRNQVRERLGAKSYFLPLPASLDLPPAAVREGGALRIAYCGTPRIEHRAHKLCEALGGLTAPWELTWMLDERERPQAEAIVREYELPTVGFQCSRSPSAWESLIRECDVAVHTLFSVFGHPGPYLQISLMAGVPAIVTRFASSELLPDNVVWKIEPGELEAAELREVLAHLAADRHARHRELVRTYAVETFGARAVAAELAEVFRNSLGCLQDVSRRWRELSDDAHRALLGEARELAGDSEARAAWDLMAAPAYRELGWMD